VTLVGRRRFKRAEEDLSSSVGHSYARIEPDEERLTGDSARRAISLRINKKGAFCDDLTACEFEG